MEITGLRLAGCLLCLWCVGCLADRSRHSSSSGCTANVECDSGFCVNGVCCNSACSGGCDRCDLDGREGVCTTVSKGSVGSRSCGLHLCSGESGECSIGCESAADCVQGSYCVGGACLARLPIGLVCDSASECESGFCVDGVCCDTACDGACVACSAAAGGTLDGVCRAMPEGRLDGDQCGPLLCSGEPGCRANCSADAHCTSGLECSFGQCLAAATISDVRDGANGARLRFSTKGEKPYVVLYAARLIKGRNDQDPADAVGNALKEIPITAATYSIGASVVAMEANELSEFVDDGVSSVDSGVRGAHTYSSSWPMPLGHHPTGTSIACTRVNGASDFQVQGAPQRTIWLQGWKQGASDYQDIVSIDPLTTYVRSDEFTRYRFRIDQLGQEGSGVNGQAIYDLTCSVAMPSVDQELVIASGTTTTLGPGRLFLRSVTVSSGSRLQLADQTTLVVAGTFLVEENAVVTTGTYRRPGNQGTLGNGHSGEGNQTHYNAPSGAGYESEGGSGRTSNSGGYWTTFSGGGAYDFLTYGAGVSVLEPVNANMAGSTGGVTNRGRYGGEGGGAVKVIARAVTLSAGSLWSSDGQPGSWSGAGDETCDAGGSGGSIWIVAGELSGGGTVRCGGGKSSPGGAGAGGRVRIDYGTGDETGLTFGNASVVLTGSYSGLGDGTGAGTTAASVNQSLKTGP